MRNLAFFLTATAFAFVSGCAQIPVTQLSSYTQAFSQAQSASEQILLDYDQTLKEARAFLRARQAPAAADAPAAPYPLTWAEASNNASTRVPDDIEVRRLAFKVVADYNAVLVQLAEGKSVQEVKVGATGLLASADKFLIVAKGAGIPGLSSITSIVATLSELFEKARLREEFVQAAQKGAPVVQRILDALIADIGSHYDARAALLNRERVRTVAAMRSAAESVQKIAAQNNVAAAELDRLEKTVNEKLAAARDEIPVLPVKIGGGGPAAAIYSPVAQAQVRDEENTLDRLSKTYADNVGAMKSLGGALDQYRKLLQTTQASLKAMVKSLSEPVDLAANADEILSIVFALRRDLGELHAARASR